MTQVVMEFRLRHRARRRFVWNMSDEQIDEVISHGLHELEKDRQLPAGATLELRDGAVLVGCAPQDTKRTISRVSSYLAREFCERCGYPRAATFSCRSVGPKMLTDPDTSD